MPVTGILYCDICGNQTTYLEAKTYSAAEFKQFVERGYEPEEAALSFMGGFGFSKEEALNHWRQGILSEANSEWLLCPACAAKTAQYAPKQPLSNSRTTQQSEAISPYMRTPPEFAASDLPAHFKTNTGTMWRVRRNSDGTYSLSPQPDILRKTTSELGSTQPVTGGKMRCPRCRHMRTNRLLCQRCGYVERRLANIIGAAGLLLLTVAMISLLTLNGTLATILTWGGGILGLLLLTLLAGILFQSRRINHTSEKS